MAATRARLAAAIVVLVAAICTGSASAKNYTVGTPRGSWDLQTNYASWVSSITFNPGDNLIFEFTNTHDVLEVTQANYASCNANGAISSSKISPTVFPLTTTGSRYFICGVPNHCSAGMKVQIDVVSAESSPSTPSSPPGSAASPPPPKNAAAGSADHTMAAALSVGFAAMVAFAAL